MMTLKLIEPKLNLGDLTICWSRAMVLSTAGLI